MKKISAGILVFRRSKNPFHITVDHKKTTKPSQMELLLGHYGGPFFKNKDEGTWTIPKGETEPGEDILAAALREFHEETGHKLNSKVNLYALGSVKQKSGKEVYAWGVEDDGSIDASCLVSNSVKMEYPKNSGKFIEFPEMDRYEFFSASMAKNKIKSAQITFIDKLEQIIFSEFNYERIDEQILMKSKKKKLKEP